jgi:hypothetical protein
MLIIIRPLTGKIKLLTGKCLLSRAYMNALHMQECAGIYVDMLAQKNPFVNKYFEVIFGLLSFL